MKIIRKCDNCGNPMGNSWHTETDAGELEVYVHVKCVKEWCDKQILRINNEELACSHRKIK
jgi:hypothetical protein